MRRPESSMVKNTVGTAFMVTRKLTRHVHVIGIAVSLWEVMMEFESEDKLDQEIDKKIGEAKNDLEKSKWIFKNFWSLF